MSKSADKKLCMLLVFILCFNAFNIFCADSLRNVLPAPPRLQDSSTQSSSADGETFALAEIARERAIPASERVYIIPIVTSKKHEDQAFVLLVRFKAEDEWRPIMTVFKGESRASDSSAKKAKQKKGTQKPESPEFEAALNALRSLTPWDIKGRYPVQKIIPGQVTPDGSKVFFFVVDAKASPKLAHFSSDAMLRRFTWVPVSDFFREINVPRRRRYAAEGYIGVPYAVEPQTRSLLRAQLPPILDQLGINTETIKELALMRDRKPPKMGELAEMTFNDLSKEQVWVVGHDEASRTFTVEINDVDRKYFFPLAPKVGELVQTTFKGLDREVRVVAHNEASDTFTIEVNNVNPKYLSAL